MAVSKALVKYQNILNTANWSIFPADESNLFALALSKTRTFLEQPGNDYEQSWVDISYDEISAALKWHGATEELSKVIDSFAEHSRLLTVSKKNEHQRMSMVLFPAYINDLDQRTLQLQLNAISDMVLNNFYEGNWTAYDLRQYSEIHGHYARVIYRYLKQYRTTGLWVIKRQDFFELLEIPKTYRMRDVDKQILNPTIDRFNELGYFIGLTVTKNKKGRSIDSFTFKFQRENVKKVLSKQLDQLQVTDDQLPDLLKIKQTDGPEIPLFIIGHEDE